jgi:DNA polymerase bacteriophage-type
MTHIEIDFETRSDVDLKTRGAYNYFASPHARVMIGSFKIDDGPVQRWEHPAPCPVSLRSAVEAGATISAHNAAFEILCFEWLHRTPWSEWPMPRYDQFRCTAATAAAMSLPRDLATLGEALNLPVQKDKEGWRLIRLFSMPRRPRKGEDPNGVYFNEAVDHPEDWEKFKRYCDIDVETEAAADKRMVPLSDYEQRVWQLSETINRRGIRIDRASASAALRMADKAKVLLDRQMRNATNGSVSKCSEVAKLTTWVAEQGVELASANKTDISDLLADCDDLPEAVETALKLRQEAAKTSVSKLQAMLNRASDDSRVRGTFMYHGAGPGRWTSMGVNFANMPRPRREFDEAHPRLDVLFAAIRHEDPTALPMLYGPVLGRPLDLISDAVRGFVWAAPGHDLIQADYSGIENAVCPWLAGEEWKLKALHEIKADPSLPDMYRRTAAAIMGLTTDIVTKKHPYRQKIGKTSELSLQYGGGVSAFHAMSRTYNMRLAELHALYEPVWRAAGEEDREKATKRYESCLKRKESKTDVLTREAWVACEIVKRGWRATNAAIAKSWKDLEGAVREAVQSPGVVTAASKVSYVVKMGFLWAKLPSGRCLAYAAPRLKDQVWAKLLLEDGTWGDAEVVDRDRAEFLERKGLAQIQGPTSPKCTVLGVDSATKQWRRYGLYGGLIQENNTQAVARDLLVNGMFKAEAAGYPIIAHVYDEIISEIPRGFGDVATFEKLICELPDWADGLPLTAGGWRGKRYRKE